MITVKASLNDTLICQSTVKPIEYMLQSRGCYIFSFKLVPYVSSYSLKHLAVGHRSDAAGVFWPECSVFRDYGETQEEP